MALSLSALLLTASAVAALDTDGDGLRDAFEKKNGLTSHRHADSDGDGVIDAAEDPDGDQLANRGEQRFGTDPADPDSDRDGTPDGREDADGDGISNAIDQHQRPVPTGLRPSLKAADDDIAKHGPKCGVFTGRSKIKMCDFGDLDSETSIVWMGDSKASMYLPPAISVAKAEGWHLSTLLKPRCSPVLGTTARFQQLLDGGRSCGAWRRNAFDWLNDNPVDLLVLVFSDDYVLMDSKGRKFGDQRKLKTLTRRLAATVAAVHPDTKVVLLADAPKSTVNAGTCLPRNRDDMSACLTTNPPPSAKRLNLALRQTVLDAGGAYRSLEDRICPTRPCPLVQGDVLIYRDKGHLTVTFTKLLAPSLRAALASLLPPTNTTEPSASAAVEPSVVEPSASVDAEASLAPAPSSSTEIEAAPSLSPEPA